jgi:hypothetical protein
MGRVRIIGDVQQHDTTIGSCLTFLIEKKSTRNPPFLEHGVIVTCAAMGFNIFPPPFSVLFSVFPKQIPFQ